MAERSSSDKATVKEAVYGIKGDVKTLQQLSSSGEAARKKRQENHKERIMGALGEAVQTQFSNEGTKQEDSGKK